MKEGGGGDINLRKKLIFKEGAEKFSWPEELQRKGKLHEDKDLSILLYCHSFFLFFSNLKSFFMVMNKLIILNDFSRFYTHVYTHSNHIPFILCASAVPISH